MYKRKEEMKDIAMFFAIAGGWLLVIALIIAMSAFMPDDTTPLECNCQSLEVSKESGGLSD